LKEKQAPDLSPKCPILVIFQKYLPKVSTLFPVLAVSCSAAFRVLAKTSSLKHTEPYIAFSLIHVSTIILVLVG
jgi:hypothetical protein